MWTDLFADVRKDAEPPEAPLFADAGQGLSPSVTRAVWHEEPQKSAMPHASHASHPKNNGAQHRFPLTAYMVALMKHPNLQQADPKVAAEHYGLSVEICQYYLEDERRRRQAIG